MDIDGLVARFPRIWHATTTGAWSNIQASGIRTSLDLLTSAGRAAEAAVHRSEPTTVSTPNGDAVLRKQITSRPDPEPHLDGLTSAEWWTMLNARSYFFLDRDLLDKFVAAQLEAGIGQDILTFETRRLLGPLAESIEVTTVNTSVFPRVAGPSRGRSTFQTLADFTGLPTKIREITMTVTVPITDSAVISAVTALPGETPVRIWPPVKVRA